MLTLITHSAGETRKTGEALGGLLAPGDVIALDGDLGSGKTTLVQGIAAGWGSPDRVTSPTFVIINVYTRPPASVQDENFHAERSSDSLSVRTQSKRLPSTASDLRSSSAQDERIHHMDAYRLTSPAEAADLDLDACLAAGPLVVEWASQIREALPDDFLHIAMTWLDDERRGLDITARGERYEKMLAHLAGFLP